MIVIAVIVVIAAMAVPAFGATLARSRIQTNAAQMVQDLRLVRESAIAYQQDLYVYICTGPAASDRTVYYYELFQENPVQLDNSNQYEPLKHYTPTDAPVSGKFVQKTVLYGMSFGLPVQSGAAYSFPTVTEGGKNYFVLAFCCGKRSNFRGQPTVVDDSLDYEHRATFSSAIGIPVVDTPNSRTWYVSVSPTGQPSSSPSSP
jgi:hypothetical protein